MSLLMEALKQAEQKKRGAGNRTSAQAVPVPDDKFLILECPAETVSVPLEAEPLDTGRTSDASDSVPESLGMEEPAPEAVPDVSDSSDMSDTSEAAREVAEETVVKPEAESPHAAVSAPPEKEKKVVFPPIESGPSPENVKVFPAVDNTPASTSPNGQAGKVISASLATPAFTNSGGLQNGTPGQAKNLFAAKKSGRPSKKMLLWVGGVAVVVALAAGQGYRLWTEYSCPPMFPANPPGQSVTPAPGPPGKPEVAKLLPSAMAPAQPGGKKASPVSPVSMRSKGEKPEAGVAKIAKAGLEPVRVKPDEPKQTKREERPAADSAALSARQPVGPAVLQAPVPAVREPAPTFQIMPVDQTDRRINNAYQDFLRGDMAAAGQNYQLVLLQDPANRDALLGLAAMAMKKQEFEEASGLYLRLLALDPKDPVAQAGMLSLNSGANPDESESRIKIYLSQEPNADYLHFVLGTLYMNQARWPEAQQAFFRACQINPINPDYAFNLAVSLDHLNEARLAAGYYRTALVLAEKHPANFDRESLLNRLQTITDKEARP